MTTQPATGLTGRAPVSPCDFYLGKEPKAGGNVFENQLASFFIDIPAGGETSGFNNVMVIRYDADADATIGYAGLLYLYAGMDCNPSEGGFIRMEDNGDYPLDYYIMFTTPVGAHGPADIFFFNGTSSNGHNYLGTVGDQAGYIKLKMGTQTRYIGTYASIS